MEDSVTEPNGIDVHEKTLNVTNSVPLPSNSNTNTNKSVNFNQTTEIRQVGKMKKAINCYRLFRFWRRHK